MENWQFLLQKQGDRSWRPLELPNEEIIEGRYRVVARSNRTNIDVEVRITHTSTLEMPPKRRLQKRMRRINSDGLMAVVPFTYLKPGIWDLYCSSDLISDVLGTSWQQNVQLHVLPKVTGGKAGQEEKDEFATAQSDSEKEEEAIIELPVNPVWLKGETAEQILNNLIELALPTSEPVGEDEHTVEDNQGATSEPPLKLTLDRSIYVAYWGQSLTINGRVELTQTTPSDISHKSNFERIYSGEIRIELRSPQSAQLVRRVRQSLPEKLTPFDIRCSVEIPAECVSKLILANICLYGTISLGGNTMLLAKESFIITADIAELLAISTAANKSESDTVEDTQVAIVPLTTSEVKKSNVALNLELFNIVKIAKTFQPVIINPAPKKPIPPKINRLYIRKSAPQLPRISQGQDQTIATATVLPELPPSTKTSDKDDTVAAISPIKRRGTIFPYLRRIKAFPDDEQFRKKEPQLFKFQMPNLPKQQVITEAGQDSSQLVAEDPQLQNASPHEESSQLVAENIQTPTELLHKDSSIVEDTPQQQLVSETVISTNSELIVTGNPDTSPLIRKWIQNQGYALPEPINIQHQDDDNATDIKADTETQEHRAIENQEQDIETQEPEDAENQEQDTETQEHVITDDVANVADGVVVHPTDNLSVTSVSPSVATLLAQEIVVDDTLDEPSADISLPHSIKQGTQAGSDLPVFLPIAGLMTQPLPIPQLYLSKGELISGKSIKLRVRLSERRPELAVKLWVEDCQTRLLIDGPRWLTNLLPLSSIEMEEVIHINVPFGCLEIRISAIAVDMATQQESDKITIQRTVVPPDLPTLLPDELLEM